MTTAGGELPLSARELHAATLHATGATTKAIAAAMGLSASTVEAYLEQARLKYAHAGRPASDVKQLRVRLVEDGYLED